MNECVQPAHAGLERAFLVVNGDDDVHHRARCRLVPTGAPARKPNHDADAEVLRLCFLQNPHAHDVKMAPAPRGGLGTGLGIAQSRSLLQAAVMCAS